MAKKKVLFECQHCGLTTPKWMGKCTNCGSWDSFVELNEHQQEVVKQTKSSSNSSLSSSDNYVAKREYMYDISDYAATAFVLNLSDEDYMIELSTLAERHCITDWEGDESTYLAIGMGLRQAGVSKAQVLETNFVKHVSKTDQNKLKLILTGYHS